MTRMSTFTDDEVITVTPMRAFPVIRDLVTDVSFNYQKARQIPSFAPPAGLGPGEYRMAQVDVERSQEFRKCIECFLCQNVCHVTRDHEENKQAFSGPRFFIRAAELDMHPLDARTDRREFAQEHQGIGLCNITKCCTEVCPEHIKITDNGDHPDEGTGRRPASTTRWSGWATSCSAGAARNDPIAGGVICATGPRVRSSPPHRQFTRATPEPGHRAFLKGHPMAGGSD